MTSTSNDIVEEDNEKSEPIEDYCERCGEYRAGKLQWMFYSGWLARFPKLPIGREFYCFRCRRIMRIYAAVGFTLFAIILAAIIAATIWANSLAPGP